MNNSNLPLVLITHSLPNSWLDRLEGRCRIIEGPPEANQLSPNLLENLGQAEGLFSLLTIPVNEDLLSLVPKLKVVSNMAVGYDNIDIQACTKRGIPVGNTPGVLTNGTADLTMAILLAAARRLIEANLDARQGRWQTWSPTGWLGKDLQGSTLGIVGMGQIGKAVAERAVGFGLQILFTDPNPQPNLTEKLGARQVPLENLLAESDFVSMHVPLTPSTRKLINEDTLKSMKNTSILVNTSRGGVVDQDALLLALNEGWISGAALDVTEPEPLPPDHEFFNLPNCLIVPHIGSATWHTRRMMAERACLNLIAGLEGKPLPYCVNPEVYQK